MKKKVAALFVAICTGLTTFATAAPSPQGHPEARAYRQAAEQRFRERLSETKEVGMTVCSVDNRIGYVEQIAGQRIKVEVRGMAAGRHAFGKLPGPQGPFEFNTSMMSMEEEADRHARRDVFPVKDPYFFWQGQQTVQMLPFKQPQTVWELAAGWAGCPWDAPTYTN